MTSIAKTIFRGNHIGNPDVKNCLDLIAETGASINNKNQIVFAGKIIGHIRLIDTKSPLKLAAVVEFERYIQPNYSLLDTVFVREPNTRAIASNRARSRKGQVKYLKGQFLHSFKILP